MKKDSKKRIKDLKQKSKLDKEFKCLKLQEKYIKKHHDFYNLKTIKAFRSHNREQ